MAFEKTVPLWTAAGTEPPSTLKASGFTPGYKPPADYFNWFWSSVSACLTELQAKSGSYEATILESGDLNNATTPGLYTYSSANSARISNVPEANIQTTFWVLPRLLNDDPTNVVQFAYTQSDTCFIRNRAEGTWSAWRKLFDNNDTIPITNGGTGATTAAQALANLGAAAASHGTHVPDTCTTITDWNAANKTGWYMGNAATNGPSDNWFMGYVIAHNTNYVYQEVYLFTNSSVSAADVTRYIRSCYNGTWTPWVNVTVQRTVPADAKLQYTTGLTSDAQAQLDNKMGLKPGFIELAPNSTAGNGGYLDFHYNGDTADFTSRIIEAASGQLQIKATMIVDSDKQAPGTASLRNTAILASESTPTANGQINWQYE